jgi:hypothetical protein
MLKAIQLVVTSAANGMKFLQNITELAGLNSTAVSWSLPDGYVVEQDYRKCKMRRIETVVSGSISIKKDKVALVQQDLMTLTGLNLDYRTPAMQALVDSKQMTCKDARELTRLVKTFMTESGMLKLYRSEVEALMVEYAGDFSFDAFCVGRYAKLGIQPNAQLYAYVREAVEMIVRDVMSHRHLRDEVVEEIDEETGEVTKRSATVVLAEPTEEIDVAACVRGVGPNYIHSLDSCHMRMTVAAAAAEGITGFAMVHDSYGTHAADMTALARILREQFVALHSSTGLEKFAAENVAVAGVEEVAAISKKYLKYGDLQLVNVLDSQFFFA